MLGQWHHPQVPVLGPCRKVTLEIEHQVSKWVNTLRHLVAFTATESESFEVPTKYLKCIAPSFQQETHA